MSLKYLYLLLPYYLQFDSSSIICLSLSSTMLKEYEKLKCHFVFTHGVINVVVRHEGYNFLDDFNEYNQIRMHPGDHEKMAFVMEWNVFVAVLMMLSLKTAPTKFQRIIMEIFGEYIPTFMDLCFWTILPYIANERTTWIIFVYAWRSVGRLM